jgi:hypothetical protein
MNNKLVSGTNPARILHALAGHPAQPGFASMREDPPTLCRICGLPVERGQRFGAWIPPTATDWACWQGPPDAQYVCEACAWVRSGKPVTAIPWTRGAFLATSLRLYSHLWDEVLGWRWATLSGKRFLRDELRRTLALPEGVRWFAVFADGGLTAKQSLAYATVQRTGQGRAVVVREVERVQLALDRTRGTWPLLDLAERAYQAGWSKAEIEAAALSHNRIKTLGVAQCDALRADLRPHVGSAALGLAVWLAQREEMESGTVRAIDAGIDPQHLGGPAPGLGPELPRQTDDHVEPHSGHDVQRGPSDREPGPLVHPDLAQPADREPGQRCERQLSLLDLVEPPAMVPRARRRSGRGGTAGAAPAQG